MTKTIIIGVSLSGKSTTIKHLRAKIKEPILEIDDELERLNGGSYPTDLEYKNKVIAPKIIKDILGRDNIIFFTNTDYFSIADLENAKENGFIIIQLDLKLDRLIKRNEHRVKYEGYDDLSKWLEGMVKYQENIREKGLVDKVINTDKPAEQVAEELAAYSKKLNYD